jgi:Ca2+-dependent lipid-binding protein
MIRPLTAQLKHDTSLIMKMDPYLKIFCGNHCIESKVSRKEGTTPSWDQQLSIRCDGCQFLRFEVWDNNKIMQDDLIGFGIFDLTKISHDMRLFHDWIPLKYKDECAGQLLIEIEFIPDKGSATISEKMSSISDVTTGMPIGVSGISSNQPGVQGFGPSFGSTLGGNVFEPKKL